MYFTKSSNNRVWQLRGIVSVGAVKPRSKVCDPGHFVIFTDVTKYLVWIKNTTNLN